MNGNEDGREAVKRGRYLARIHPELRPNVALAVAFRERGYSTSGIARKIDVSEGTVRKWMEQVAARFGPSAIETKWEEQRQGPLTEPTTDELRDELSPGVLADYLEYAQDYPDHVPKSVDPLKLEDVIEFHMWHARENPEDVHPHIDPDDLEDLLGGWFGHA